MTDRAVIDNQKLWVSKIEIDTPLPVNFFRSFSHAAGSITRTIEEAAALAQLERETIINDFINGQDEKTTLVFQTEKMMKLYQNKQTLADLILYWEEQEKGEGNAGPYSIRISKQSAEPIGDIIISITANTGEERIITILPAAKRAFVKDLKADIEHEAGELLTSKAVTSISEMELLDTIRKKIHIEYLNSFSHRHLLPFGLAASGTMVRKFTQLLETVQPETYSIAAHVQKFLQRYQPL